MWPVRLIALGACLVSVSAQTHSGPVTGDILSEEALVIRDGGSVSVANWHVRSEVSISLLPTTTILSSSNAIIDIGPVDGDSGGGDADIAYRACFIEVVAVPNGVYRTYFRDGGAWNDAAVIDITAHQGESVERNMLFDPMPHGGDIFALDVWPAASWDATLRRIDRDLGTYLHVRVDLPSGPFGTAIPDAFARGEGDGENYALTVVNDDVHLLRIAGADCVSDVALSLHDEWYGYDVGGYHLARMRQRVDGSGDQRFFVLRDYTRIPGGAGDHRLFAFNAAGSPDRSWVVSGLSANLTHDGRTYAVFDAQGFNFDEIYIFGGRMSGTRHFVGYWRIVVDDTTSELVPEYLGETETPPWGTVNHGFNMLVVPPLNAGNQ